MQWPVYVVSFPDCVNTSIVDTDVMSLNKNVYLLMRTTIYDQKQIQTTNSYESNSGNQWLEASSIRTTSYHRVHEKSHDILLHTVNRNKAVILVYLY